MNGRSNPTSSVGFQVYNGGSLKPLGLTGAQLLCVLREDGLELFGQDLKSRELALADIARIRVGFTEGKRRVYQLDISLRAGERKLTLIPVEWPVYRATVYALAQLLADRGRIGDVETGTSKVDAVLAPALLGALLVASVGVASFTLTNEPWWGRLMVPLAPFALFALFLNQARIKWPTPIGSIVALKRVLPPE